jgi:small subunit ribosomal protein S6
LKTYEALFIFDSQLKDDALDKIMEGVRGELEKQGGQVQEVARLGVRDFSREMKKKHAGYYVRVRFQMDPAKIHPLQARFKLNESIFRVQVVQAQKMKVVEPKPEAATAATEEKKDGQS